jgi:hypothetical protein
LSKKGTEKAQLLRQLADEADRGVLFTVEHSPHDKIEIAVIRRRNEMIKIARMTRTILKKSAPVSRGCATGIPSVPTP